MASKSAGKAKKTAKHNGKSGKTKHNSKDSVFTHLFLFPKYQLEMYRAIHPEDKTVVESDIETITRECVIAQHAHNDLGRVSAH